jgi:hypothetical protein
MIQTYTRETAYIKRLLPDHYECHPTHYGVHCVSAIGIDEIKEEAIFRIFHIALKVRYGDRLMEIYHQTCTNHCEFTVFIKPEIISFQN